MKEVWYWPEKDLICLWYRNEYRIYGNKYKFYYDNVRIFEDYAQYINLGFDKINDELNIKYFTSGAEPKKLKMIYLSDL